MDGVGVLGEERLARLRVEHEGRRGHAGSGRRPCRSRRRPAGPSSPWRAVTGLSAATAAVARASRAKRAARRFMGVRSERGKRHHSKDRPVRDKISRLKKNSQIPDSMAHSAPKDPAPGHAGRARRPVARPGHRRPGRPDLPDAPASCCPTPTPRRRSSTWKCRGTCTRGCPTRRWRCSRSAWRRSRAASAPSPPRAARPPCTWPSPRSWARAATSSRRRASTAARTTCCTTPCPASASRPRSSRRATPTPGGARSGPTRGSSSARRWATRRWTCSTSRRSARSPTSTAIPLLVDATVTTPYLGRALDMGAHLVMHSATKFLSGHGVVIGGVLVDGGPLRLGRLRQIPDAHRALRGLPRHGVHRGVARLGVPAARAPRGPARLRRLHGGDDRLPDPAGARDAAPAHAAARRDHARPSPRSSRSTRRWRACTIPDVATHPDHALARAPLPAGCSAILSFELEGRARGGAQVHRGAHALLAPRQHRRRQVARDPPGLDDALPHGRRGARAGGHHARAPCACRSASSIPDDLRRGPLPRAARLAEMNFIVQGYPAYAYTGGRPFDPALPAVVFVHGAALDHSAWQWQSRYLAHHGFARARRRPARPRPQPRAPLRTSIEALADWVAAFIEAACVERAHVVGPQHGLARRARHGDAPSRRAWRGWSSLGAVACRCPWARRSSRRRRTTRPPHSTCRPSGATRATWRSRRARFPGSIARRREPPAAWRARGAGRAARGPRGLPRLGARPPRRSARWRSRRWSSPAGATR